MLTSLELPKMLKVSAYYQEKSHEGIIRVLPQRKLVDGLPTPPCKHRECSWPQCGHIGRHDLWLYVPGQEME